VDRVLGSLLEWKLEEDGSRTGLRGARNLSGDLEELMAALGPALNSNALREGLRHAVETSGRFLTLGRVLAPGEMWYQHRYGRLRVLTNVGEIPIICFESSEGPSNWLLSKGSHLYSSIESRLSGKLMPLSLYQWLRNKAYQNK